MVNLTLITIAFSYINISISGTSYMFNTTWGNAHKIIPWQCTPICGHRQYNATIKSQTRLMNNSWYVEWLKSKGNRLYDLENQLTRPYFNGNLYDYALMEDHRKHLMNDTSVLHFYFGKLKSDRKKTIDPAASPSNHYYSK